MYKLQNDKTSDEITLWAKSDDSMSRQALTRAR